MLFIIMITFKLLTISCFLFIIIGCGSSHKTTSSDSVIIVDDGMTVSKSSPPESSTASVTTDTKKYSSLQFKYAKFLNIPPEEITNLRLYGFIDQWLATPYLWGGTDKNGIDCSAFVQKLLGYVYKININIPRTSMDQFFTEWIDRFWGKQYLAEGDLIFFRTDENKVISHIGLYLKNRMFVNSSSSKGVSIACLDDPYWKKHFVAAGRIKSSMLSNPKDK